MKNIIDNIMKFLVDNKILITIIGTVLSTEVANLSKSLVDNIIMPLINIDLNRDGKPDRQNLDEWEIEIKGTKIKIGSFLLTLIEFGFIVLIIFLVNKYSRKYLD